MSDYDKVGFIIGIFLLMCLGLVYKLADRKKRR